jgi:hypothetical protein
MNFVGDFINSGPLGWGLLLPPVILNSVSSTAPMERPIAISEDIAHRLERYLQQHPHESVSGLLEEILQQKENNSSATPKFLRIQPAATGSGYRQTSIPHDQVLAETAEEQR